MIEALYRMQAAEKIIDVFIDVSRITKMDLNPVGDHGYRCNRILECPLGQRRANRSLVAALCWTRCQKVIFFAVETSAARERNIPETLSAGSAFVWLPSSIDIGISVTKATVTHHTSS